MATTSAYDYGIRQGLVNKGVNSADIGYNPGTGYVTVKGQNAIKAPKVYNGTSFTSQQDFNTQYDAFNKSQQQAAASAVQPTGYGQAQPSYGQTPAATQQATQQYNPYQSVQQNPYTSQADTVIQQLLNYGQNQPNFDPYSSSGYAAAQAQAQRSAQANTRAAQEAYGSAGFGRSTGLGERVAGINNDATEYLMTQVVPQLEAQEQARRQQEYNNIINALSPLMNQQGRADDLVQRDFDNNLAITDRTGYYKPEGSDQIISQLLALKGQAETKGITAADRSMLSSQADALRAQLQGMGVDTSSLGANVSRANAASGANLGTRTLAGRQLDEGVRQYNQNFDRDVFESDRNFKRAEFESDRDYNFAVGQQEWENNFNSEQFNWQKAQQAWENTFQEKNFQQSMQEAAAARGLQWASLTQRKKEAVADQAFRDKQFEYQKGQDKLKQTEQGDYATDPSFAQEISWINQNKGTALTEIESQSDALIAQYGYEGYQELLKAAGG